ncbi:TipAS antibiotic-recognition domain-containing protein [Streptomyces wuyuanensis]|uniref:TipAS antibiotic-recognition domain-containing protein n=1 Tax=Streptomyces wuyuanensis TaxID=1196353 RepID=A0A1G9U9S0_9ACTN|nr:TipAS antibiotic-recognition domain-containing protein [Streptomyces wuyuanensis]
MADPRFTAEYDRHGEGTAVFVRDATRVYAERHLSDDHQPRPARTGPVRGGGDGRSPVSGTVTRRAPW